MHIKLYLGVTNLEKAYEFYRDIFNGTDIKLPDPEKKHASIKMFDKITFLIYRNKPENIPNPQGWFIIRFEREEVEEFLQAVARIKANKEITVTIEEKAAWWGTTFFEFKDPFGFTWDLEIDTDALPKDNSQ